MQEDKHSRALEVLCTRPLLVPSADFHLSALCLQSCMHARCECSLLACFISDGIAPYLSARHLHAICLQVCRFRQGQHLTSCRLLPELQAVPSCIAAVAHESGRLLSLNCCCKGPIVQSATWAVGCKMTGPLVQSITGQTVLKLQQHAHLGLCMGT